MTMRETGPRSEGDVPTCLRFAVATLAEHYLILFLIFRCHSVYKEQTLNSAFPPDSPPAPERNSPGPFSMLQPDDPPTQPASGNTTRARDDLIEQAVFTLTPFFLDGASGDLARARRAAVEMLKAYPINSPLELQLATEFIAFSHSAMDELRLAIVDPEMPEPQRRRLRAGAVALNQAGHRTLKVLERVYESRSRDAAGQPEPAPQQPPDLTPEQLAMLQAMRERVAQAREQMAREQMAQAPEVPVAMNREQRRAAEQAAQRDARRAAG